MSDATIKVWISKYALSEGVFELCAETTSVEGMISDPINRCRMFHDEGKDWHRTREGAIAKAEQMRLAKIASLKKQIAKLEKLKFE